MLAQTSVGYTVSPETLAFAPRSWIIIRRKLILSRFKNPLVQRVLSSQTHRVERTLYYNRRLWWTQQSVSCSDGLICLWAFWDIRTQRETPAGLIYCFCLFLLAFNCFTLRRLFVEEDGWCVCLPQIRLFWWTGFSERTDTFRRLFSWQNRGGAFDGVQLRPLNSHTQIYIHTRVVWMELIPSHPQPRRLRD